MKRKTWLIVANGTVVKVYDNPKVGQLELMKTFQHPEGRLSAQDIESDARGQEFQSVGASTNTYEPPVSPEKHEAALFAREVCDYLEHQRTENGFERLYIAAAPSFLGLLRQAMSSPTTELVVSEEPKDVTNLDSEQLMKTLSFAL